MLYVMKKEKSKFMNTVWEKKGNYLVRLPNGRRKLFISENGREKIEFFEKSDNFSMTVRTGSVTYEGKIGGISVKVFMFVPEKIPCKSEKALGFYINTDDKTFEGNAVGMGNPHCVIFTEENSKKCAKTYGKDIEIHPIFPQKTNVEFVNIRSEHEIDLDVWERGCGITLACGTGACAATVAGILTDNLKSPVKVNLPGGSLHIEWNGSKEKTDESVFMTGPAEFVFTGEIEL